MGRNICVSIMKGLMFFLETVMGLQKYEGKGSKHVVLQIPKWLSSSKKKFGKRETCCDCDFFHTLPKIKILRTTTTTTDCGVETLSETKHETDLHTVLLDFCLQHMRLTGRVCLCLTRSPCLATTRLALFKREWQALIWIWPSSPSYLCRCCMPSRKRKLFDSASSYWNTQKIKRRPRATRCEVAVIKISNAWILQTSSVPC